MKNKQLLPGWRPLQWGKHSELLDPPLAVLDKVSCKIQSDVPRAIFHVKRFEDSI